MTYQVLCIQGTTGTLPVPFDPPFAQSPIVLTTPYWQNQRSAVGSISTVTGVSPQSATIVSGNAATNYFVNVLAIEPGQQSLNEISVTAGSMNKTSGSLRINLDTPLPSVNLLNPLWVGSTGSVGNVDTLSSEDATGITVVSGNAGQTYFTQYLSTVPSVFPGAQAGITHKQGTLLRVYFQERWESPPLVFVSSWYKDAGQGVGGIETLSMVTRSYFDVVSGNMAANYFVSWLAIPGQSDYLR